MTGKADSQETSWRRRLARTGRDVAATLVLWLYFTLGFVLFFLPRYLWAMGLRRERESAFQHLNSQFYRTFFVLLRFLAPQVRIRVGADVRRLKGAVVVSNHVSYLDPLLFTAQFPFQKTIVKSLFFRVPIFGWFITQAGYMPASASGPAGELMIRSMATVADFFRAGGVFFVFPEGTRQIRGRDVDLHEGAFKIASRYKAPLAVVRIRNTEKVFPPGRFLFRTTEPVTITVDLVALFNGEQGVASMKPGELKEKVKAIL
jgi:1-acyl-sn-glycerol-3-phosphate acyltransferase